MVVTKLVVLEERNFRSFALQKGVPPSSVAVGKECSHSFAEELTTEGKERMAVPFYTEGCEKLFHYRGTEWRRKTRIFATVLKAANNRMASSLTFLTNRFMDFDLER
jgi:hypothetical protein